jgi:ferric-dicitrate binding protein FerR (iron transport regulator)
LEIQLPRPRPILTATPIRLRTLVPVVLIACAGVQAAPPQHAVVLFVAGTVTATTRSAPSEAVKRGGAWQRGQVLRAAGDGRAQVRFPDGTLLSVSPGAHVRLDEFRYDGKGGAADVASFSVLRGQARIMAGAQRTAGSALRIGTPAAAMEAGTAEVAVAVSAGSVQVRVGRGRVELRNDSGRVSVGAGQRALVKDRATPPMLIGTIVPAPITPPAR